MSIRMKQLLRKLILMSLLLTAVTCVEAAAEEFPFAPLYDTASYIDCSAESPGEQRVYSFVQTTWKYYPDLRWTGPWSCIEAGGQKFFYFGCGICSLTNIYDTLTGDVISPTDMYQWCREYTDYDPDSGRGALSWGQISEMCRQLDLDAKIRKKPSDYETFRSAVAKSETTLALVCKWNDKTLWSNTEGHYVTLWEYDEPSDTVFVADSSGLHNRHRVNLKDVYKALKTSSQYQYMTVQEEEEP